MKFSTEVSDQQEAFHTVIQETNLLLLASCPPENFRIIGIMLVVEGKESRAAHRSFNGTGLEGLINSTHIIYTSMPTTQSPDLT